MRLVQGLHRAAAHHPDAIATVFGGRRRSWREVADRVARLSAGLRAMGVAPGDRVAIIALNSDVYVEAYYAIALAGAISVPGNTRWAPSEHAEAFRDSTPRVTLADAAFLQLARELPGMGDGQVVAMDPGGAGGVMTVEELIAGHQPGSDEGGAGDETAAIFYTGGTTGSAKGVMLTHDGLLSNFLISATAAPWPDPCVFLHSPPMFHMADAACLFGLTLFGATHVAIPSFQPAAVIEAIRTEGVNSLVLVPTMIGMLAQHLEANPADLSGVKKLKYGASPITGPLLEKALEIFPNANISQAYGQTELSPAATILTHADHLEGGPLLRSAGRPLPTIEVRICDAGLKTLPTGEVGEILVRSDSAMKGYWRRPELTAETFVQGWLRTGDAGYLDARGYLYIVDRVKDMIVSGGENVYSAEVEKALATHPAILECAVIGVPDPQWGERVHAIVRLRPGMSATPETLTEHCQELIAGFKKPRSYEFRDAALPLSAAGKVLKRDLREAYWADAVRRVG